MSQGMRKSIKPIKLCPHGVMLGAFCDECETDRAPLVMRDQPDVAQSCWVRIHLKSGGWIDIEQMAGFRFDIWLGLVKGAGGVNTPVLHIPLDNIALFTVLQDPQQELKGMHVPNPGRPN